jgi:TonB family protein
MKGLLAQQSVPAVEVKVSIDKAGKVTHAVPASATNLGGMLGRAAATAVRFARFHPARLNGEPVASELVVRLTFSSQTR